MSPDIDWYLVIHCADTPDGYARYTAYDIDRWHAARGFLRHGSAVARFQPHFSHIGYHAAIEVDGSYVPGRAIDEHGAHAAGYNDKSWGVCMIGRDKFTLPQWNKLREVIVRWFDLATTQRKRVAVIGHRMVNSAKTCPGFDVNEWIDAKMIPLQKHVCKLRPYATRGI